MVNTPYHGVFREIDLRENSQNPTPQPSGEVIGANPSETSIRKKVSALETFIERAQTGWNTTPVAFREAYETEAALEAFRETLYNDENEPPYQINNTSQRTHAVHRVVSILNDRYARDQGSALSGEERAFYEGQITDIVKQFSGRDYNALMILAHAAQKSTSVYDATIIQLMNLHKRELSKIHPKVRVLEHIEEVFPPMAKIDEALKGMYIDLGISIRDHFNYLEVLQRQRDTAEENKE